LPRSEQLTRPTDFEIGFSDDKAIMGLLHHLKTLLGGVGKRLSIQQQAVAVDGAAPDPSSQLMQLGEPSALRVVDDHLVKYVSLIFVKYFLVL